MDMRRGITIVVAVLYVVFWIAVLALAAYLLFLIIKALRKYVNAKEVREEKDNSQILRGGTKGKQTAL